MSPYFITMMCSNLSKKNVNLKWLLSWSDSMPRFFWKIMLLSSQSHWQLFPVCLCQRFVFLPLGEKVKFVQYLKAVRETKQRTIDLSILSYFSKVFEMAVYEIPYAHVRCQIIEGQHGFIKGRSSMTYLTFITQYTSAALDDSSQVDVYTDNQSKALDRLDHGSLVRKLYAFGLTSKFISFLKSHLVDRKLLFHF